MKVMDVTYRIGLQEDGGFHLGFSLLCSLALRKASCSAVSCPLERPMWQGTTRGLLLTASEELDLAKQSLRR